ncbi:acyl carrier protein [Calocera viscosa TUFC12733]|uniref:Acyl carrier protein n=1 Tax=Calocera viscosa (strain TUFC12733) TaxID=1330018 RepID=A0A167LUY6_CALVF|nr:acyl carrier protein [Calocera viscosa TUFC12733]
MSFARCARLLAPALRLRAPAVLPAVRFAAPSTAKAARFVPLTFAYARAYSSGGALSKDDITGRVMEVLKSFEKVDGGKLSTTSSFTDDLGLDSLDAVEVVMAIEEEFSLEIPDAEADAITTVQEAIDYIAKTPEAV